MSVVTAKDIERHNVTTIQEALQYVPGLYMNQAKAQDDQIMLRGMDTPNILVLVDGVQLNSAYDGAVNFDQIPVEAIERIEVLRGAASSIYGVRAVYKIIFFNTIFFTKCSSFLNIKYKFIDINCIFNYSKISFSKQRLTGKRRTSQEIITSS